MHCVSLSRCAVVYAGGLHVMVWRAEGHSQLGAMVEVPQTFYNRTVGLMGLWSSNRSDDFLMSDGRLLLSADLNPPSEERLHDFGLSCESISDVKLFSRVRIFEEEYVKSSVIPTSTPTSLNVCLCIQGRFPSRRACCSLQLHWFH